MPKKDTSQLKAAQREADDLKKKVTTHALFLCSGIWIMQLNLDEFYQAGHMHTSTD